MINCHFDIVTLRFINKHRKLRSIIIIIYTPYWIQLPSVFGGKNRKKIISFIVINFVSPKKTNSQLKWQQSQSHSINAHTHSHSLQLSRNFYVHYLYIQSFSLSYKWSTRCLPWTEHNREITIWMRIFNRWALFLVVVVVKVNWWFNAVRFVYALNKTGISIMHFRLNWLLLMWKKRTHTLWLIFIHHAELWQWQTVLYSFSSLDKINKQLHINYQNNFSIHKYCVLVQRTEI